MNSLLAFGIMAGSGILTAWFYDIFRAAHRALDRIFQSKKRLAKWHRWLRPLSDVLAVFVGCLLFICTAYACNAGEIRSYIVLGYLFGLVFYAGLLTHLTGNLAYGVCCGTFYLLRLLFYRMPRRIWCALRRRQRTT